MTKSVWNSNVLYTPSCEWVMSLSHSKLEIAGNSMKFQKSYQKSVWISQTCGKQKSGIPRTLPKKVWIPMQNCRKRYGFQCKMVKKKYGIPMSSIGGGSFLSGIAHYELVIHYRFFNVWTLDFARVMLTDSRQFTPSSHINISQFCTFNPSKSAKNSPLSSLWDQQTTEDWDYSLLLRSVKMFANINWTRGQI